MRFFGPVLSKFSRRCMQNECERKAPDEQGATAQSLPYVRRIQTFLTKSKAKQRMRAKVEDSDQCSSIENAKDKAKYALIRRIGTGSVSTCYEASRAGKGNLLVLKIVESDASASSRQQIRNEICHLRRMERHQNIVRFIDSFCDTRGRSCVAMEHCEHGSLADYLEQGGRLGPHRIANVARQILKGLQHIHRQGVIHRDLKLGNILLTADFCVKITDFGLAAAVEDCRGSEAKLCGTPNYLAPEVCQRRGYSFASDVWSFGVCLYTLCVGQVPFHVAAEGPRMVPEEVISQTMAKIVTGRFYLSEKVGPVAAIMVLASTLIIDPRKRPTIEDLLDFEFLSCVCNSATCVDNEPCRHRCRRRSLNEPNTQTVITSRLCESLLTFQGEVQQLVWVKCWGQVTADSLHFVLSNNRQGVLQRSRKGMRRLDSQNDETIFHDLLEYTQQLELDLTSFYAPSTPPSCPDPNRTDLCAWHYCPDGSIGFLFDSGAWQINFVDHVKLLIYRNSVVAISGDQGIHENFCSWLHADQNQHYLRTVRDIVQVFGSIRAS